MKTITCRKCNTAADPFDGTFSEHRCKHCLEKDGSIVPYFTDLSEHIAWIEGGISNTCLGRAVWVGPAENIDKVPRGWGFCRSEDKSTPDQIREYIDFSKKSLKFENSMRE